MDKMYKARERLENYINTFLSIDDSRDILRVAHEEQGERVILVIYDMCGNEKDRINVTANSTHATITEFYRYMGKGQECFGLCRRKEKQE